MKSLKQIEEEQAKALEKAKKELAIAEQLLASLRSVHVFRDEVRVSYRRGSPSAALALAQLFDIAPSRVRRESCTHIERADSTETKGAIEGPFLFIVESDAGASADCPSWGGVKLAWRSTLADGTPLVVSCEVVRPPQALRSHVYFRREGFYNDVVKKAPEATCGHLVRFGSQRSIDVRLCYASAGELIAAGWTDGASPPEPTRFDYAAAWVEVAAPMAKRLPEPILKLYRALRDDPDLAEVQQDSSLGVPMPERLAGQFEALAVSHPAELALAAQAIYDAGHWCPTGLDFTGESRDVRGAYWKFEKLAKAALIARFPKGDWLQQAIGSDAESRASLAELRGCAERYTRPESQCSNYNRDENLDDK